MSTAGNEASISADVALPAEGDLPAPTMARRQRVARGVIVNSAFMLGLGGLNMIRSFIVAAFLTAAEFGVWSIVLTAIATIGALKTVVVTDKYVQQEEPDQELAYQRAFTLELLTSAIASALMLVLAPLLALAYGDDQLLLPAAAMALLLPALAFSQMPVAAYYRRLEFFRQRLLLSVAPVVATIVTLVLVILDFGYWGLVIGMIVGAWAAAAVAALFSPYRFAWRYDRGTLREYASFSGPLLIAVFAGLAMANLSLFLGELSVGLAGAGVIGLAAIYSAYAKRIDQTITQTLYPAVCRVVDRQDLLLEVFTKSNRLALLWGVPFGVGLALFAGDLIDYVLGPEWQDAEVVLAGFGILEAVNVIGFNWSAFMRAHGRTRPIAVVTVAALIAFCAGLPLLFLYDLPGFVAAVAISTAVSLAGRWYYLSQLFPGFEITVHVLRAFAPTVAGVAAALAFRALVGGDRTAALAVAEMGVFVAVTVIASLVIERALLREAVSYLRRSSAVPRPVPSG